MAILTLRQLIMLLIATLLSITNMASLSDFSFILFSIFYTLILSKFAFPATSNPNPNPPPVFTQSQTKLLSLYVSFAAIIGLLLPVAYIIDGIYAGDTLKVQPAAPHLLLLAGQVFMEGVSSSGDFALPVRVFVPVFYNSKRIFTIVEWMRCEFDKKGNDDYGRMRRLYVGRGLAVANMVFWCFNLFCFLLPVFLPKAFKIYYSSSKKTT